MTIDNFDRQDDDQDWTQLARARWYPDHYNQDNDQNHPDNPDHRLDNQNYHCDRRAQLARAQPGWSEGTYRSFLTLPPCP